MSDVIIDTSSLLSFALVITGKFPADKLNNPCDVKNSIENEIYYNPVWSGFENTLEALTLYDEVYVDGASFNRNLSIYPELEIIEKYIKVLQVSKLEESNHYRYIEKFYKKIQGSQATVSLFKKSATLRYLMEEVEGLHNHFHCSIQNWENVENILPKELLDVTKSLKTILGENTPWSSTALISILRLFYYQSLQSCFNIDLLLHPDKGRCYDNDLSAYDTPIPAKIVDMFDEKVRAGFYSRKEKWFGKRNLQLTYPMLTQYILNKKRTWNEVLDICINIKHSRKAKNFRHEIAQLKNAINNNDNVAVDETISALDKAVEEWSKDLSANISLKKKITVTIPMIVVEASTELLVPDKNIGETPGNKILIFIHEILSHS